MVFSSEKEKDQQEEKNFRGAGQRERGPIAASSGTVRKNPGSFPKK